MALSDHLPACGVLKSHDLVGVVFSRLFDLVIKDVMDENDLIRVMAALAMSETNQPDHLRAADAAVASRPAAPLDTAALLL
ncbi:hypothetical protein [Sphaerisporangium rhizosphaerae]|uniref:Uncharacterized protein n=1 Tax=Sphaerisporangium rhizosphaerae TaxID=2269375 RepID=A0ABW2P0A5_9ACTN